jgi:hypothetical protein
VIPINSQHFALAALIALLAFVHALLLQHCLRCNELATYVSALLLRLPLLFFFPLSPTVIIQDHVAVAATATATATAIILFHCC